MDTLRIIARRENRVAERDIKLFYDEFLASIGKHGRIYEIGLLIAYNLKSGHIMTDADLGPKVLTKGKIHFLPDNIEGREKVAKIFERFQDRVKRDG